MADKKLLQLADDLEGFGRRPLETPTDMGWRERILVRLALAEILRRLAGVPPVLQASDFNPDWSMLEATQESLREHMAMIRDLQSRVAAAAILAKQVSSALAEANVPASVKNDVHELRRVLFIPGSAVPSGVASGDTAALVKKAVTKGGA